MVTPIRDILRTVAQTWNLEPAARLARAQEAWSRIVGQTLAEMSAPVAIRGGRLSVGVVHAVAGQEIRLRRTAIVRALARELGEEAVTDVLPVPRRRLPALVRTTKRTPG